MVAISIADNEIIHEDVLEGLKIVMTLYLLSVHYPRAYQILQWMASSVDYAEKTVRWLVRLTIEGVLLKVTGISDAIDVLFKL